MGTVEKLENQKSRQVKGWHRRLALQLASQLPDKDEDVRAVMLALTVIVNNMILENENCCVVGLKVID